jgi:hypothetical protein
VKEIKVKISEGYILEVVRSSTKELKRKGAPFETKLSPASTNYQQCPPLPDPTVAKLLGSVRHEHV